MDDAGKQSYRLHAASNEAKHEETQPHDKAGMGLINKGIEKCDSAINDLAGFT